MRKNKNSEMINELFLKRLEDFSLIKPEKSRLQKLLFEPIVSMITGFGIFWWYSVCGVNNIWLKFMLALYITAIMQTILNEK